MEIVEHLAALRRDGALLAAVAAASDLDVPVPTCPGWSMRDLVRHVGGVHRWAATHVAERRVEPVDGMEAVVRAWPDDASLVDWFREGHAFLVHALETAEPDLRCWSFLPAPSPLAFWARRQAHETGVHRVDAESTVGPVTSFDPAFAVDGIDELLFCFVGRPGGTLRTDRPYTLHIHADDAEGEWLIHVASAGISVRGGHAPADCTVRGVASDLHLLLWNRLPGDRFAVEGDASLLDRWRDQVRILWS